MHVTHTSVLTSHDCSCSPFKVFSLIIDSEGILLGLRTKQTQDF